MEMRIGSLKPGALWPIVAVGCWLLAVGYWRSNSQQLTTGSGSGVEPPPPAVAVAQEGAADLPRISLVRAFPRLTFPRPVFVTHAGDGSGRLFVVEQAGRIRVFEDRRDVETAEVFLDIRPQVLRRHNEEGLLSLAFHPRYAQNGHFYVYYSASKPRRGVLSRFSVAPDVPDRADPASEQVILEVEQRWGNHNGSTVLFGDVEMVEHYHREKGIHEPVVFAGDTPDG